MFGGIVWVPDWARQQPLPGQITQPASTETAVPKAPAEVTRIDLSWVVLLIAVVVLGVVAILIWRAVRKRLQRTNAGVESLEVDVLGEVEPDAPQQPDAPQLRRGLDRALDILGEDREPRDAIERPGSDCRRPPKSQGCTGCRPRRRASSPRASCPASAPTRRGPHAPGALPAGAIRRHAGDG